jgi:hypothetical protein
VVDTDGEPVDLSLPQPEAPDGTEGDGPAELSEPVEAAEPEADEEPVS